MPTTEAVEAYLASLKAKREAEALALEVRAAEREAYVMQAQRDLAATDSAGFSDKTVQWWTWFCDSCGATGSHAADDLDLCQPCSDEHKAAIAREVRANRVMTVTTVEH